jgi:hypothetical protein
MKLFMMMGDRYLEWYYYYQLQLSWINYLVESFNQVENGGEGGCWTLIF